MGSNLDTISSKLIYQLLNVPLARPVLPTCSPSHCVSRSLCQVFTEPIDASSSHSACSSVPHREESLKEQRHLLSSLPLLQCSSSALTTLIFHKAARTKVTPPPAAGSSAHLTYQQQPTQLLTAASSGDIRMALSPPSSHFLPGLSSPPVIQQCSRPGVLSSLPTLLN